MAAGLTKRQAEALTFIRDFIAANGYSPSFREIMSGTTGGRSTNDIHRVVHELEERGAITLLRKKHRSIALMDQVA